MNKNKGNIQIYINQNRYPHICIGLQYETKRNTSFNTDYKKLLSATAGKEI